MARSATAVKEKFPRITSSTYGGIPSQCISPICFSKSSKKIHCRTANSYARFDFMKDLDCRFEQFKEANSCDMAIVFVRKHTDELQIHNTFKIIGDHYNIATQVVCTRPAGNYDGYIPTVDNILLNLLLTEQSNMEMEAESTYDG
jgi:hypothetical protein